LPPAKHPSIAPVGARTAGEWVLRGNSSPSDLGSYTIGLCITHREKAASPESCHREPCAARCGDLAADSIPKQRLPQSLRSFAMTTPRRKLPRYQRSFSSSNKIISYTEMEVFQGLGVGARTAGEWSLRYSSRSVHGFSRLFCPAF
jgi:hypothetical protein